MLSGWVDDAEQWCRRGGELADEGGAVEAEALALLNAAVAAGYLAAGKCSSKVRVVDVHRCKPDGRSPSWLRSGSDHRVGRAAGRRPRTGDSTYLTGMRGRLRSPR